MEEKYQEKIDGVMDEFDFERVHRAMMALNWKWFTSYAEDRIPTIAEIRREARRLLKDVILSNEDYIIHSTGGFKAFKDNGDIGLEFILSDYQVSLE